ncbi:Uncharacterised protein [Mycobacterium tuberculosis]|uniref:Uncharacterized protein n=1 Tax=Mycobacterium tuberculosis TaxID=1773 RepID=A0A654TZC3_MYCTX|nr:lipoprotein DsbF [Mycobacterium tuberculosis variant bovis BCG]CFR76224.1 Uncharacterised protein [Mycobacterium tuberculosis]CKT06231.1 Uncharacterised protein [Mycobacterium tuberculosis]CNW13626.1 Uncharacterised protein [Mycobacterium tuberculosis]
MKVVPIKGFGAELQLGGNGLARRHLGGSGRVPGRCHCGLGFRLRTTCSDDNCDYGKCANQTGMSH